MHDHVDCSAWSVIPVDWTGDPVRNAAKGEEIEWLADVQKPMSKQSFTHTWGAPPRTRRALPQLRKVTPWRRK